MNQDIPLSGRLRGAWRAAWARWYFRHADQLGPNAQCSGRPDVANAGRLVIGRSFLIECAFMRSQIHVHRGGVLTIGDGVFVNFGTTISASSVVEIGDRALIANQVTILDHDFHGVDRRHEPEAPAPIRIGPDAWIGLKAIVLKGVTIGRGAVVAAGSVVTRDVPEFTLVAGSPARPVRALAREQ
ncbi:MAG TPA: acyltransferase [Opitutaceae bacterium]|nr:acyltransferase [Opitutaceae bacterium]